MSPSDKFKMPIIGELKTKGLKVKWIKENGEPHIQYISSEMHEVIAETETTYTLNKWLKEHKSIPMMVPKGQVEIFIKRN